MWTLPVVASSGNALVTLDVGDEAEMALREPPLHALVVVVADGSVLFCHAIAHKLWELPGGGIEADESPRCAAARELFEETGIRVDASDLVWAGLARYRLRDGRRPSAALYRLRTTRDHSFVVNSEMDDFRWIDPSLSHDETSPLDLAIAEWASES